MHLGPWLTIALILTCAIFVAVVAVIAPLAPLLAGIVTHIAGEILGVL